MCIQQHDGFRSMNSTRTIVVFAAAAAVVTALLILPVVVVIVDDWDLGAIVPFTVVTAFAPQRWTGITMANNNHRSDHRSGVRVRTCLNVKKMLRDSKEKMLNFVEEMEEKAKEDDRNRECHPIASWGNSSTGSTELLPSSSLFYNATSEDNRKRLDTVVAAAIKGATTTSTVVASRSLCSTLVTDGQVVVNGITETRKSYQVTAGMQLEIRLKFSSLSHTGVGCDIQNDHQMIVAQDIPLSILYEDDDMIVLNKAAGMVVHPAVGNRDGTIVNALAYYLTQQTPFGRGEFVSVAGGVVGVDDIQNGAVPFPQPNALMDEDDDIDNVGEAIVNDIDTTTNNNNDVSQVDYELQKSLVSLRPGIVHRLDKGTTGVMVVAKTRAALAALAVQFGGGDRSSSSSNSNSSINTGTTMRAEKTYLAITVGNPGQRVVIDRPIGRHPVHRQRMRVVPDPTLNHHHQQQRPITSSIVQSGYASPKGRRALSFVDTIAFDGKLGFVKVRIETGRTHQIRVHLQDRHTPIYGDDIYGISDWNKRLQKTYGISRPMLHAFRLKIKHPITGESMTFTAPLPDDMRQIIKTIYPLGEEENPDIFASELPLA